ncbi:MAG: NYN domain-containing protein, partial [Bacteroidales bacterium]
MNNSIFNIAVLIDGDNAQAKIIKEIIEEVSKYGKVTIRRIYGDWTTPQMNSWKEILNNYSISPIQKFNYTTGKNSTDSSLIIDAMDILHSRGVHGFCIVSSDSDYTGLAKRIREEGLFVMGIGRKSTPIAFVNSCEIFTFTENLTQESEAELKKEKAKEKEKAEDKAKEKNAEKEKAKGKEKIKSKAEANGKSKQNAKTETTDKANGKETSKDSGNVQLNIKLIDRAFEISINEEEEAYISTVGTSLRKLDPSFDSRTYGFKTLTKLFESLNKYV